MFNAKQPLWMPQGSVRAILSLLIIIPIAIVALRSNIMFTGDQVIGLANVVLLAYFVQKTRSNGE